MKKLSFLLLTVAASLCVNATDLKDLKIYINPGHGGHDSDDRGLTVPPFEPGDPNGFWESNSNLSKGLSMRDLLEDFGVNVMMSRVTNTTEDDRDLHEIGYEANDFGADYFFSIHSNATGTGARKNQPLMLYRGHTDTPEMPENKVMAGILNNHLLENRVTSWSDETPWLAGDYDFYDWGEGVGLGVLRKLTVPGMLSEGSYHDYTPETYRLLNDNYCWLEAYHFTKAIMEYFQSSEKYSTGVVAGTIMDDHQVRTDPIYNNIFFGHDEALPVSGATVTLKDSNGEEVGTSTTDELFNGVYMFRAVQPGTYTLSVSHPDYELFEQEVTVTANEVTYLNPVIPRVRKTPPEVVSYSPVWAEGDDAVLCNAPIVIEFNWDMNTESVENNFSITPAVEGDITWEDSYYKMIFKPKRAFETNTVYTVKIAKGVTHPANLAMENDFTFSFKTGDYNTFDVLASNPEKSGYMHYKKPTVEFRFKQKPNTLTIMDDITVHDESGAVVSYNRRSRKISGVDDDFGFFQIQMSKDLEVGKTYTVNLNENVRDENDMPLAAPYSYKFTAVDVAAEGASLTMTESFDGNDILVNDADNTVGAASSAAKRNTGTRIEGTAAYGLDYEFNEFEGGKVAYAFATPNSQAYNNTNALGLKVYGDLSCNTLYARMSNGTDEVLVPVCVMTFLGWKDTSVSLADFLGSGDYNVTGFEIAQTGGQISREGTVYVDKMSIGAAEDAGVSNVETENVRIYPNPASELLIANGDKFILKVELVSLDGQIVASAEGNVLNVSEIPSGMYVAKIYTQNGYGVKQVIVKH